MTDLFSPPRRGPMVLPMTPVENAVLVVWVSERRLAKFYGAIIPIDEFEPYREQVRLASGHMVRLKERATAANAKPERVILRRSLFCVRDAFFWEDEGYTPASSTPKEWLGAFQKWQVRARDISGRGFKEVYIAGER